MRYAHTIGTEDTQHLAVVEFAKKVAEKTNGAVQVDIFPAGQLGNDSKILEGIKLGTKTTVWRAEDIRRLINVAR